MKKNDPILKIIEKSGNGFHLKVNDHLKSLGWDVDISQYYSDPVTGKPREIDIIAKKKFQIGDSRENILMRFFIECKYVSDENVIWFMDKDLEKTKELISSNRILRDCEEYQLRVTDGIETKIHHYMNGSKVAKLTAKNGNTDIFFDGMNGCLHGLISLENQDYETYRLDYPLIVLNSFNKIHEVVDSETTPYSTITENFQLAVDYSYLEKDKQVKRHFIVDVVSLELLTEFLKEIEDTDIQILKNLAISEIRERRYQEQINRRDENNYYDPFSAI